MKTFRQFITEGSAYDGKELIFADHHSDYPIPFAQPMWERITNVKRWGYGMHVTDWEDSLKVIKMQGKKNQISTMTNMRKDIDAFVKGGGILNNRQNLLFVLIEDRDSHINIPNFGFVLFNYIDL